MRCSSKSTPWAASAVAALALVLSAVSAAAQVPPSGGGCEPAVRQAVLRAMQERLGAGARVTVDRVTAVCRADGDLVAVPEPGARLGRPVGFTLLPASVRPGRTPSSAGYATADVRAEVRHVVIGRPVAQGTVLTAADLVERIGDVGVQPLAAMPVLDDVEGTRASRNLKAGDLVTAALLRAQPLVRSGDLVRTCAYVGQVAICGQAVAQQSGQRNVRIKLINPESRKPLTGLITGAGEVVILHES